MATQRSSTLQRVEHWFSERSTGEKLAGILLAAALARSFATFTNLDANVYSFWLDYFLQTRNLPYYDHPPIFFLVAGAARMLGSFISQYSAYLYSIAAATVAGALYRGWKDRPAMLSLCYYLVTFTGFILFLGNSYEHAVLASFAGGLLTVYATYRLGTLWSTDTGLVAAVLSAFSWWHVVYSTTLIVDMFATALIALSYYTYYNLIETNSPDRGQYILTGSLLTAALLTKYYAALILPIILAYGMYRITKGEEIVRKAVPGIVASLLFLGWLVYTDFYALTHYASTHYLFTVYPDILAFPRFLWYAFTPLILVLTCTGIYHGLKNRKTLLIYLSLPFLLFTTVCVVQTYLYGRSHYLVNLTNYILPTTPMLFAVAGYGWQRVTADLSLQQIATILLAAALITPFFTANNYRMEYDDSYRVASANLNTLGEDELRRHNITAFVTGHFKYSFIRQPTIRSSIPLQYSHFRWHDPTTATIIALDPVQYILHLKPFTDANITVMRGSQPYQSINLAAEDRHTVMLNATTGRTTFTFDGGGSTPLIALMNTTVSPRRWQP